MLLFQRRCVYQYYYLLYQSFAVLFNYYFEQLYVWVNLILNIAYIFWSIFSYGTICCFHFKRRKLLILYFLIANVEHHGEIWMSRHKNNKRELLKFDLWIRDTCWLKLYLMSSKENMIPSVSSVFLKLWGISVTTSHFPAYILFLFIILSVYNIIFQEEKLYYVQSMFISILSIFTILINPFNVLSYLSLPFLPLKLIEEINTTSRFYAST